MDQDVALNLALLQSREDSATSIATTMSSLSLLNDSAEVVDLEDGHSEAADDWDLCDSISISSSWLDLERDRVSEEVLEDEGMLILRPGHAENALNAAKPRSFADALVLGLGSTPARTSLNAKPTQHHTKPRLVTDRMLKPIPDDEEDDHAAWEMYKARTNPGQFRRRRKKK
jgi:hypothetical protein